MTPTNAQKLMLACCGASGSPVSGLTPTEHDVEAAAQLAAANGVLAQFFDGLMASEIGEKISSELRSKITLAARERVINGLRFRLELAELSRIFSDAGLTMVALKGPALAEQAYSKPSLRDFGDLDILVPSHQRDLAIKLMLSAGYKSPYENTDLDGRYHVVFISEKNDICVELHWRIAGNQYPSYSSGEFLLENTEGVSVGGSIVLVPKIEEHFVYLCIHAYKHDWERVQWIRDIPEVLRRQRGFDWERCSALAYRLGAKGPVTAAIQIAQVIFPGAMANVPLAQSLQNGPLNKAQMKRAVGRILAPERAKGTALDLLILRFPLFDNWRDGIRFLTSKLHPTDRDTERLELPRSLFALYYVIRPIRLIHERLKRVFHR